MSVKPKPKKKRRATVKAVSKPDNLCWGTKPGCAPIGKRCGHCGVPSKTADPRDWVCMTHVKVADGHSICRKCDAKRPAGQKAV